MKTRLLCRLTLVLAFGLSLGIGASVDAEVVGAWLFDEGSGTVANDSSGNGLTGVIKGNPVWLAADGGMFGSALQFVENQYVDFGPPNPPALLVQQNISFMTWVKPTRVVAHWQVLFSMQRGSSGGEAYAMTYGSNDDQLRAIINTAGGNAEPLDPQPFVWGEWIHAAATYDGDKIILYRNGEPVAENSANVSGALNHGDGAGRFAINGNYNSLNGGLSEYAVCTLDEVLIFDEALSQSKIQAIMESGFRVWRSGPGIAKDPVPQDAAADVPFDATLSWAAGEFAATHDVYLGSSFDDVNAADRAAPKGVLVSQGQSDTSYSAGAFEFGKTYYWRVDEVNAAPDSAIYKGKVWSFTAEPFAYPLKNITATASSSSRPDTMAQNTVNGSGLNANDEHSIELTQMWMSGSVKPHWIQYEFDGVYKLDSLWVWNANQIIEAFVGFGAKDVTIEYSADGVTWTALEGVPEFARGSGLPTYGANTIVDFGGVMAKFVKLTINSNWGSAAPTSLSEVRFFHVPVQAREPQPAAGATGVALDAELNWRPGREAQSHKVYFGADEAAVAAGSAAAQTVAEHSYAPASLSFGTEYFWKVDEVGDAGTYAGDVWSFVTQEYAPIDDFESYTDDEGSRIYESWLDGIADAAFGHSMVGYMEAPFAEKSTVHGGGQSMPLTYDNAASPYYSEAVMEFDTPQNWTTGAAANLSVYHHGAGPAFAATSSGGILMNGLGADIWGASDQFRFAYKTLNGNGSIVARVLSVYNSNDWAKAGVMIRQGIEPGSTHAFMAKTTVGGNGASFQRRLIAGGESSNSDAAAATPAPYWVKVERVGDKFSGYISPDGTKWTQLGEAQTIAMTGPVLIGLAVCSHDAAVATNAEFSDVATTGSVAGDWQMAEIGATQQGGNSPEAIYLTVKDSSGKSKTVANPDSVATARNGWRQWTIPLSEFTSAGVKMTAVKSIAIGVGNRTSPTPGGAGVIYLDDIGYGRPLP